MRDTGDLAGGAGGGGDLAPSASVAAVAPTEAPIEALTSLGGPQASAASGAAGAFDASGGGGLFAVVIPASNEEGYLGACLDALLASDAAAGPVGILVAANGCRDGTVTVARARAAAAAARGWRLVALDIARGHKTNALNLADAALDGLEEGGAAEGAGKGVFGPPPAFRAYLDADVVVEPALIGQLRAALARPGPAWAAGQLHVPRARSPVTRAYARIWTRLPFMTHAQGAPGAGFYAVNAAGRGRWGAYPDMIADDLYVRLHFAPRERLAVPAGYAWPMIEGFSQLVRVRRRQNAGVDDLMRRWPELLANEDKPRLGARGLLGLVLSRPADAAVYGAVSATVRVTRKTRQAWDRGR